MTVDSGDELTWLRDENARLISLLDTHGIAWRQPQPLAPPVAAAALTTAEKVTLFRHRFHGRTDVHPVRWESKAGKTGYSPACANEWLAGVCEKPRIKCADCGHRQLMPLTDQTIYDHLAGRHTVGVYPLLSDDSCHFLAVDFDDADWRADDVTFITEEDQQEPWKRTTPAKQRLPGPMPASLTVTLDNLLYFDKASLPQALANRLIRLAAFQNPEFYKAQAMRLSVWDEPRVIGCAENFPNHIALPRGCLDAVSELLRENGIRCELRDERFSGEPLEARFAGTLRPDQEAAVAAMLRHDTGILCAPTAFGKTVTAAALIARRGVNTLVLVHRTELLKQ